VWSIGIIAYLLLCGCLPFDDEHSEREIARQTIHDPTPFPGSLWKKLSSDAKTFVENLLNKDPIKRMKIKEVMEHPWLQKYNKNSNSFINGNKTENFSQFENYTNININTDTISTINSNIEK